MQFRKNTRPAQISYIGKLILKIAIFIIAVYITILLVDKIDFPSPNKVIEKQVPNEKIKIIK